MRRTSTVIGPAQAPGKPPVSGDWHTIARLLPYLWAYRWRVALALGCLVTAKFANVGVPLVLKHIVDALDLKAGDVRVVLVVPVALLVAYGALRLAVTVFTELRELLFARVTHDASRTIMLQVFRHLFSLSLRFHLDRQMGGMSRLTPEIIARSAPDIIIATDVGFDRYGSPAKFRELPGVALTPAAKSLRIHRIDETEITYFGPRTPAALRKIAGWLHPGR